MITFTTPFGHIVGPGVEEYCAPRGQPDGVRIVRRPASDRPGARS